MKINQGIILIIAGIILIAIELSIWTSYILPLGISLLFGGIALLVSNNQWISATVFAVTFLTGYWISFSYSKSQKGFKSSLKDFQNQQGVIIEKIDDFTYKVRFPLSVAGEEVWIAYSEKPLSYGDKVKVTRIKGNKIIIKKS